jgi:tRNA (guanine37-N1)-methyltransferase
MIFHVLTIFPEIITLGASASILGKAFERGTIHLDMVDIRDFATDKHRVVDDYPYGGGPGMVLKAEPIVRAINSLHLPQGTPLLLLTPQGERFSHTLARELAASPEMALICGRYEGIDERVRKILPIREVSIGDFILTGGEFAALTIIDAVARFVPGVLGDQDSSVYESFTDGLLEYPQYTRPADYMDYRVPEILLSGDHGRIAMWRRRQALMSTQLKRPDLLESADLTDEDRDFLEEVKKGIFREFSDDEVEK